MQQHDIQYAQYLFQIWRSAGYRGVIYCLICTIDWGHVVVERNAQQRHKYHQTNNKAHLLYKIVDKIVDNSDVIAPSPVVAAPTTSSIST